MTPTCVVISSSRICTFAGAASASRGRTRKPSVARVIQQMKRAGVEIAGCEINPRDGTVRVIAAQPTDDIEDTTPIDRGEWN